MWNKSWESFVTTLSLILITFSAECLNFSYIRKCPIYDVWFTFLNQHHSHHYHPHHLPYHCALVVVIAATTAVYHVGMLIRDHVWDGLKLRPVHVDMQQQHATRAIRLEALIEQAWGRQLLLLMLLQQDGNLKQETAATTGNAYKFHLSSSNDISLACAWTLLSGCIIRNFAILIYYLCNRIT